MSSETWLTPAAVNVTPALLEAAGGQHLLAEMLARRGLLTPEVVRPFLDPGLYHPASPFDLPDMQKAVELVGRAARRGQKIAVWGDFDMDGQTATTILVGVLKRLGAEVNYHIPVRSRASHGVHIPQLDKIVQEGVDLVLTCDTGITAFEAAAYLKKRSIGFVITDHHALPPELPPADAVVNPARLPGEHPLRPLCGAGTAWILGQALLERAGEDPGVIEEYFDLAALGTVADVASLLGENRWLVQRGLAQMRARLRPALRAILDLADVNPGNLSEEHLAFIIAPRLNALGRLDDANPAVEFLRETDVEQARPMALRLEEFNGRRKLLCDQVFQAALAQVAQDRSLMDDPVLVLNHPDWPAGVIGIAASRLVELYRRPVIMISSPSGQVGRGSARSIAGFDITAAIAACQGMLEGFGGHPMAGGLGIRSERVAEFRRAVCTAALEAGIAGIQPPTLQIDAFITLNDITIDVVETIDRLAPFGAGNPPVTLVSRGLTVLSSAAIGKGQEHLQLIVQDERGSSRKVVWWQQAGFPLPEGRFDLAFTLRASNYRGQRDVQMEWIEARPNQERVAISGVPALSIIDLRAEGNWVMALDQIINEGPAAIWREGQVDLPGNDRNHLEPARTLVVLTIPPGRAELQAVLRTVLPQTVYLFGLNPAHNHPQAFLQHLTGFIRHIIASRQGQVSLAELAAAAGQRETAIRCGLDWLAGRGFLAWECRDGMHIQLAIGGQRNESAEERALAALKTVLKETAAYRAYYLRTSPGSLLE